MADAVDEGSSVPGGRDRFPPGTVDLLARRPDRRGGYRASLSQTQHLVQLDELRSALR